MSCSELESSACAFYGARSHRTVSCEARLQNAEVALSSFATEKLLRHAAYTDPALESRPLAGINTRDHVTV